MQPLLNTLRSILVARRHDSSSVGSTYKECFARWKGGLLQTHGFSHEVLDEPELEDLYLAESTFVAIAVSSIAKYLDEVEVSVTSSRLALPNVISVAHSHYGWAIAGAHESDGTDALISGIIGFEIVAGKDPFHSAFETFVSRTARHKSGAFLTPPWIADHLLSRLLSERDWTAMRFLEPSAGTGAFLAALVRRLQALVEAGELTTQQAFTFLTDNFVAIERNPSCCVAVYANLVASLSHFSGGRVSASAANGCIYLADCTDEPHYIPGAPVGGEACIFEPLPPRESFDFIIGNPPWISWETLDRDYRERIAPVWAMVGLFEDKGSAKAFSKEDISTYVTYLCIDRFLKEGGELSFILPQTIFQSSLNSRGFRNFCVRRQSSLVPLKVLRVDDMTNIQAFPGVSARAAILTLRKGAETKYPIEYNIYSRASRLGEQLTFKKMVAEPVNPHERDSPWSIHSSETGAMDLKRISGKCAYRARAGVFTGGANAAYYLSGCVFKDGIVTGQTVVERAKRKIPSRRVAVEAEFVYPFIRGRDVSFWRVEVDPARAIIFPHTSDSKMAPVSPELLGLQAPRLLSYFLEIRDFLDGRGGLTAMDRANAERGFYALLRVGSYTFAPYKLVWRYIDKGFTCAVVGPCHIDGASTKPVVPQEKLMMIGFDSELEAYFVCGVLSSAPFSAAIQSRMVGTQISAKIIDSLRVPKFDPDDPRHLEVAAFCQQGHQAVRANGDALILIREQLDEAVDALLDSAES